MSFIFGAKGLPKTPEEAAEERQAARLMVARSLSQTPKNIGDGLNAIGQALLARSMHKRADKAQETGLADFNQRFGSLDGVSDGFTVPGTADAAALPAGNSQAPAAPLNPASEDYFERLAQVESGGNPSARNPNSSAAGLYQFTSATAKQYGLADPLDPVASRAAVERFTADNAKALSRAGIPTTPGNLYLAHQQGAGGAIKLLSNPDAPAASLVGDDAIRLNGGKLDTTGRDFASKWVSKFQGSPDVDLASLTGAQPVASTENRARIAQLLQAASHPWVPESRRGVINALLQREMQANDPLRKIQMEKAQLEIDQARNPKPEYGHTVAADGTVLRTNKTDGTVEPVYTAAPKPTANMQDFAAYAEDERAAGRQPMGRLQFEQELRKAGAANTTINNGGSGKLREKLDEHEGKIWSGYLGAGTTAAGSIGDFDMLDELLKVAPQGPVEGRLAQAFPGFSSSGSAAQSIINRVAPTLRVEGSGATSDIEYQGMLASLPSLVNKPEANRAISGMMRSKAVLNRERGEVVQAYSNGLIDEAQARTRLGEINRRSILTPEMTGLLRATSSNSAASTRSPATTNAPAAADIEAELRRRGLAQ
jgi:hypothetical protein